MKTLLCAVCLICATVRLPCQTFRGGIQGTVQDASGNPVTTATVTIKNVDTGLSRTVATSSTGTYFITELPIGSYDVEVEKRGYLTESKKGIPIEASSNRKVDFQLQTAASAAAAGSADTVATVTVLTGQTPMVNAADDNLGRTITTSELETLPINARDIYKLFLMTPGVSTSTDGESDSTGAFGAFSMNGSRGRSNNFYVDGTDANDNYRNLPSIDSFGAFGIPGAVLPLDSLQEVSIISNTEAEYGRNSGATVDFITKSGTNKMHGSGYEYFRNNALDARNYFNTSDTPQDGFHFNQFGGALGGPIVTDKTFFFLAYHGTRESTAIPVLAQVPTQAKINQAIADNGGVVNPVIANLLAHGLWPAANRPADAEGNDLAAATPISNRDDSLVFKIDQHFHGNDFLTGRYFYGNDSQSVPVGAGGSNILAGFNTLTPINVNLLSLSYTHIFGLHLLTEVRAGFDRTQKTFLAQDGSFNPATVGLNLGTSAQDFGLPVITVGSNSGSYASLGAPAADPRGRIGTNYQFFNNYTYTAGKHNWKFGYEYRRDTVDSFYDPAYRGILGFTSLDDFIAGIPSTSGSTASRQVRGDSSRQTFRNTDSLYLQDNFSLRPSLTLSYGLRWEYFGVIGEAKDRFSILDSAGNLNTVSQLYPKDSHNFGPRLSLAWDVRGDAKTVLRAGWGVYYDAVSTDHFTEQLPFNTFNAGPAYNGVGPDPITFSSAPVAVLQPGVQVFPDSSFGATNVFTVDQRLRTPYVQNYNLNIQRALGSGIALQVGYVGSAGRKLFRYVDLNQVNPATGTVAFPQYVAVNQIQTSAASNYNSLQSSLRFRNLHGFSSALNYTWSHSIDNASDGIDFVPNASQPDNSFRPDGEKANSNFDQRQNLNWTLGYQFPAGRKWHTATSGWSTEGILRATSGEPYNVNYLFEGNFNGSGEFFGRPDVVGDPFSGTGGPSRLLNLSALQVPCTLDNTGNCIAGSQHFGDLGRNAFVGPNYVNLDLSVAKNTSLGEHVNIQLRLDMFNPLNHTNFVNPLLPNFAIDFLQNGMGASGRGKGFLASTATPDVGAGNPFLTGGGPRDLQLSVRLSF